MEYRAGYLYRNTIYKTLSVNICIHKIFQLCQRLLPQTDYKNYMHITSLNVDSLIGSKLPKIESTCLTTIIGLEI